MNNENVLDERIYDEMDNLSAEVLGTGLVEYITARREAFLNLEEASKKYLDEDVNLETINVFSDFYYRYMAKYSNCFLYNFNEKGYTKGFKNLLERNEIDVDKLNINWESIEKKEKKYQEGLVDILYAMISYELKKYGLAIFGVNLGFDSVLYYITSQQVYERIVESQKLIKVFDLPFLEEIYNEIFEIVGDLGIKGVEIGDFIEKTDNGYRTLFETEEYNILISEDIIDEDDESKVKIIL